MHIKISFPLINTFNFNIALEAVYKVTLQLLLLFQINLLIAQTQIGTDIDGEAAGDFSGWPVSLSANGSRIAIGAINNDGNGDNSGHVRIYEFNNGSWVQIGSDIDGEAIYDNFGRSISLSYDGSIIAIGGDRNDGNGNDSGHVRVYEFSNGSWTQIGDDINGEAAEDLCGRSVSLSSNGAILAIGSHHNDGNGNESGHVRVYEFSNGTWTQIGGDIDGEVNSDRSGRSVSLSSDGSRIAIGAPQNDGNGSNSGHVRVYEFSNGSWTQIGDDIDGEAAEDRSGASVSLSSDGSIVAIGAPQNDGNGNTAGHVRVYKLSNGSWIQLGGDINGTTVSEGLGVSVSLSSNGEKLAIGAPGNIGITKIYEYSGNSWTKITNDIIGETPSDNFGISVSLSSDGSKIAIGASENDSNGNNSGHVRVYEELLLPIELNEFKATIQGQTCKLTWQTLSETNNEGFQIEWSTNSQLWENIGFVDGAGNSNGIESYQFTHNPISGLNCYRLRQIDFDSKFKFSDIISIEFNKASSIFKISPNPIQNGNLTIEVLNNIEFINGLIQIYDFSGRLVLQQKLNNARTELQVTHIPKGIYQIFIQSGQFTTNEKLIYLD
ncbi:MAG: T9SS type A sorting domain-containing protein [Bacteroidota bacterium]